MIKIVLRTLLTVMMSAAGIAHFVVPDMFMVMMPPQLPYPLALIYVSGVAELAGGIGLQIPRLRSAAGWGLIALLVAVFPANIYMAVEGISLPGTDTPPWGNWVRLPFQALFVAWAYWVSRPDAPPLNPGAHDRARGVQVAGRAAR